MSEEKKGFFKRLLGNLIGSPEIEQQPEAAKPEAPKKAAKQPAKKPAAKAPAKAKAKNATAAPRAAEQKTESAPRAAESKATAQKAKTAPKPEPAAKPKPASKAEPAPAKAAAKSETKPARAKAPAKPAEAKPVDAKAKTAEPKPSPETEAPAPAADVIPFPPSKTETPAEAEVPPAAKPEALPPPAAEAAPEPQPSSEAKPEPKKKGWFARMRAGLTKTSSALTDNITAIFTKRKLDDETLQELEDVLIQADLGVDMAIRITEEVARGRYNTEIAPEEVRAVLGEEVAKVLLPMAVPLEVDGSKRPHVILVVGVNGTGKTTTIGKLAKQFSEQGKRVMLAAGDTFRAAAIDQLKIWGERAGAPVVARDAGADAAGLAYDAFEQAREQQADLLMIDTAGRLQNKADLMAELAKIVRVLKKQDETAPHSVLLVLDATTGQNAVSQAQAFREIAGVTGIVMTKLDGTARGGILVAIAEKFSLPIHAIGVGESIEDLHPFDAYDFAAAIAGADEQIEVEA